MQDITQTEQQVSTAGIVLAVVGSMIPAGPDAAHQAHHFVDYCRSLSAA